MITLSFRNATVEDTGYGLNVNGRALEEILSEAMGTADFSETSPYGGSRRKVVGAFRSNACNISIVIDPQPQESTIIVNEAMDNLDNYIQHMRKVNEAKLEQEDKEDGRE